MKIDFGASCKELFQTEKKWMTLLGLIVCMLIPIVGPMVAFGYLFRRFVREDRGKPAEDFDFNFFADYLKIGLWPVIATLVASLVMVPVVFLCMAPTMVAPVVMEDNEAAGIGLIVLGSILYMVALVLMTLALYPIMIRSGLMMNFGAGFSKDFIFGFIRKVGLSLVGYYLLLCLVMIPLMLVGYLALIVGVYVVAGWAQFAMTHLVYQHYRLYLARGGNPIEVDPEVYKELGAPPLPLEATAPPALPNDSESES